MPTAGLAVTGSNQQDRNSHLAADRRCGFDDYRHGVARSSRTASSSMADRQAYACSSQRLSASAKIGTEWRVQKGILRNHPNIILTEDANVSPLIQDLTFIRRIGRK
jgi:hypothetical protein